MSAREAGFLAGVAALTALAGVLHFAGAPPVVAFIAATGALAGMAWVVSFATEQVGERFGPAVTGVMQSTLGNLPEFFVVIFALSAGEVVVARFSLIGSIFANALFVLGLVIVLGAREARDGVMRFAARLPRDTATLMLIAVFIIALMGLSLDSGDRASRHTEAISIVGALVMLGVYLSWVIPYVRGETGSETTGTPRVPLVVAILLLGAGGVASAFVSDWFIIALDPAIKSLGISKEFAGLVVVAIAGNAVENVTGLVLARKGQADLAISVVKNSVAQIAAFLFPALVLVSLLFATSLTFALAPIYIGALALTAIVVWQITGDGEATAFEGWALVGIYVILAAFTLYE
ncbi:MAG: sodium:proton exchanger [Actinomycetota bacterium]|nr:sodium:proton exchanger [Actinomycetota bacterium]